MLNARECALRILQKIDTRNAYSNLVVDEVISKSVLETLDRGFCTQLVYGVLRHQNTIDHVIRQFIETPERFHQMNRWLLSILRMGVLQILYLDKVPFYSAVDEAVKLAKEFGRTEAARILKADNFAPPMTLRVNTLKAKSESVLAALSDLGAERTRICPEGIVVKRAQELTSLSVFSDGHFYIQDEASMLVAHVVDPQPLEVIMDLCASPGGKTTHLAALAENNAIIIAFDRFSHKINRIKDNCRRLGVTCVTMKIQDTLKLRDDKRAHRILVDVPCSCTGIIRHHPELKWQLTPEGIAELSKIQLQLLEVGAAHVAPGGIVVYSACSIEAAETVDVVRRFLDGHPDYVFDPFPDRVLGWLDAAVPDHTGRGGSMRFLPHLHGTDGFFVARLKRIR